MTKIIFVRHGQTEWNVLGRYQGQTDVALSPLGIEQAEKLAAHFPVDKIEAVYSSDLARAMKTASCVADRFGLTVEPRPELRELNFGDWEGLTYDEIVAKWPDALQNFFQHPDVLEIPHGESFPKHGPPVRLDHPSVQHGRQHRDLYRARHDSRAHQRHRPPEVYTGGCGLILFFRGKIP